MQLLRQLQPLYSIYLFSSAALPMTGLPVSLFAVALLTVTSASAQTTFRFGLRAGGNAAIQTPSYSQETSSYSAEGKNSLLPAGHAGLTFEANFGRLAFQPSLLFSQKGTKSSESITQYSGSATPYDYNSYRATIRTNWLEMPLNFVYTPKGDHGFQLFAGPYVALALGGQQSVSGYQTSSSGAPRKDFATERDIVFGVTSGEHRLDWGFNAGIGYRTGPLQLQAGYGLGLRNLHASSYNASYNRVAQLSATYFWGK